jgi:hypothetical protein
MPEYMGTIEVTFTADDDAEADGRPLAPLHSRSHDLVLDAGGLSDSQSVHQPVKSTCAATDPRAGSRRRSRPLGGIGFVLGARREA